MYFLSFHPLILERRRAHNSTREHSVVHVRSKMLINHPNICLPVLATVHKPKNHRVKHNRDPNMQWPHGSDGLLTHLPHKAVVFSSPVQAGGSSSWSFRSSAASLCLSAVSRGEGQQRAACLSNLPDHRLGKRGLTGAEPRSTAYCLWPLSHPGCGAESL